jgi:hypothetical protein
MVLFWVVLAALVVFVVAAVLVGREASRLAGEPPRPVFDVPEAVSWIGERLPFETAARLSHDDVRQIVLWSLDHLRLTALADGASDVLVADADTAAFVMERAAESGLDWSQSDVLAVLDAQAAYLEVIGAAGQQESPPDPGS